jgi:hypothetical protein
MNRTANTARRFVIALFALGILAASQHLSPAATPIVAEQGGKVGTGG